MLNEAGIWCSRLNGFDEFLALPGVENFFLSVSNETCGSFKTLRGMVNFSVASPQDPEPQTASLLGEDSTQILLEAGYSHREIESLHHSGIILSQELRDAERKMI